MKTRLGPLIILFSIIAIASFCLPDTPGLADLVKEEGVRTIRVAGDLNFPPYEYADENGVFKGFNIDVMRAVAIEMGLDLELIPMPWDEAQEALKKGEVDAVQGMKYSKVRDEVFDFSEPYLQNSQAIFVDRSNRYIINLEDLKETTVVIQVGDISYDLIKDIPGIKVILTGTQEEGLQKIIKGEADAFVGNHLTGLYNIQRKGLFNKLKIIGGPINPDDYGVAVKEGNRELLGLFNKGIKAIKANGTYDKIYRKWFGEMVDFNIRGMKKVIYGVSLALALTVVITIAALRWNRLLQREVRRRTEELDQANIMLQKNDRLKEQILNTISSGIITLNPKGQILSVSEPARDLTGLEREDLGQYFQDTALGSLMGPEHLEAVIRQDSPSVIRELELPGGRILDSCLYPLKRGNNGPEGAIFSIRDITREKKLKEALHRQDKIYSLGQMAAGIAHEIRNPLTSIKTFIELIPEKIHKPKFREEIARYVPAEIERLNGLITDLLEYSQPRAPLVESCLVNDAVGRLLVFFAPEIAKKQVAVETDIPPRLGIMVDRKHFQQILINLILNALDALEDGGRVKISAGQEGSQVWIQVADTGSGMGAEELAHAFEPFFSAKPNGTGLGLFVCYQFARENQGEISITSNPGEGTIVELRFLAAEEGVDTHG